MEWQYHAPWWLPSGHLQTIGSALWGRHRLANVVLERERWQTPDGDFIDVDQTPALGKPASAPLLILFHGLEGSSASHYAKCFAYECQRRGWQYRVPHFRGCSGEINRAPRAYHSGDVQEIAWIIQRCREQAAPGQPVWAIGVSLGGNALLRWAQDMGASALHDLQAVAAICAPLDLLAAGRNIDRGVNRHLYARMFLRTMKHKARLKWQQFPGLFDLDRSQRAQTIEAFDDAFTAPLHGFSGVQDYWHRASSRHRLRDIRVPTLILNAQNDPFVPAHSLPGRAEVSRDVTLWQPQGGGHVGFAQQHQRRMSLEAMPRAIGDWLAGAAGKPHDG
jgi:predicted alpha/beta-fold hydrolase